MRGKAKCKALKEIRRQIAEENDIPYVVSQCTYQGDCKGTCPKCESELRYLERELEIRKNLGKAVAVVGISTSVCAGLTACSPVDAIKDALGFPVEQTSGAVTIQPEDIAGYEEPWPEDPEGGEPTDTYEGGLEEGFSFEEDQAFGESIPEESTGSEESEDMIMGEMLPPETESEETVSELSGDIALPDVTAGALPLSSEETPDARPEE